MHKLFNNNDSAPLINYSPILQSSCIFLCVCITVEVLPNTLYMFIYNAALATRFIGTKYFDLVDTAIFGKY